MAALVSRMVLMGWTYNGKDKLASVATALYAQRTQACKISPYIFMSDQRVDVLTRAKNLPKGSTLIYRHFGDDNCKQIARDLRDFTRNKNIQFLIGQDEDLAVLVGADGLHLPERDLELGPDLRERHPDWLLSGAVHSASAVQKAEEAGLDAALLSCVFASNSPSAGPPLGIAEFSKISGRAKLPVFALGGINDETVTALIGSGAAGIAGVSAFGRGLDIHPLSRSFTGQMQKLHSDSFHAPWPETDFVAHIDNEIDDVLGVVNGGELHGFIVVRTLDDQAEILTIVVAYDRRGQGLGKRLLAAGEAAVQQNGADIIFLDVAKDNIAATALYENYGYQRCGTRPGYYKREKGRVDALLYQKKLE